MFLDFLFNIWRRFSGPVQWWFIWLINSKFVVGVSGVVFDQGGSILLQRHRHWVLNVWGLPGGIVHSGERLEDAFAREVLEETGLMITDVALIQVKSGYRLRMEAYFRARLADQPQAMTLQASEVIEARFFPVDALPPNMLGVQRKLIEDISIKTAPG